MRKKTGLILGLLILVLGQSQAAIVFSEDFESTGVADGTWTSGSFGAFVVDVNPSAVNLLNPVGSGDSRLDPVPAELGEIFATMFNGSRAYVDPGIVFQDNTSYTFFFVHFKRDDLAGQTITAQILADSTVLKEYTFQAITHDDLFLPRSIVWQTKGGAEIGQPVRLRLLAGGAPGQTTQQAGIDNIQLDATARPAGVNAPLVYVGGANRMQDLLDYPEQWEFVRQNADGLYVNFIQMQGIVLDSQINVDTLARHFRNKNAFFETDGSHTTIGADQGDIDSLQSAGFTIPFTAVNDGWKQDQNESLRTYGLLPGQSNRKCLKLFGPWSIGGDINKDFVGWPPGAVQPYERREQFETSDGFATDGPMGYWSANVGDMKLGAVSMAQYSQERNKFISVMTSPFHGNVASYSFDDYLSCCMEEVRYLEDNDADPDLWGVYEYATDFPLVPETNPDGTAANTVMGFAYYLINHVKGIPGTLDLFVTDDSSQVTGQGIFGSGQSVVIDPNAPSGTTYHYIISLTNSSDWCDYAAVLKASMEGNADEWDMWIGKDGVELTAQAQREEGYLFYQDERLWGNTSRTLDIYVTRQGSGPDNQLKVNLELKAHRGSATVDTLKIITPVYFVAEIDNSGFEAETFAVYPGYVSGNGPITGWTASDDARAGINSAGGPFANNGTIPEGAQVAFLQGAADGPKTLTSNNGITDLTVGKTYNLSFRVNSRLHGTNDPEMGLIIGGTKVLRNKVNPVGGSLPYKYVSYNFVATSSTMSLAIDNTSLADKTLLLDDFVVTEVTPKITVSPWNGDSTSGIDSSLAYTHAYNFGDRAENATVNGVLFTGIAGGNPSVTDRFSFNMPSTGVDYSRTIVEPGSATLAVRFVYGNENATLTLEGLTAGQTYRTTLFTVGWEDYGRASTLTGPDGEMLTVDASGAGNNNGRRVDIEFTATGTTEQIDLASLSGNTFHTYAFANAEWGSRADFNRDGQMTLGDLEILSQAWLSGDHDTHWNPACDISSPADGMIDLKDFSVFAELWK